jgi:hypothetical protein
MTVPPAIPRHDTQSERLYDSPRSCWPIADVGRCLRPRTCVIHRLSTTTHCDPCGSGKVNFAEALQLIEEAEARLRALLDGYVREADHEAVNQFMVEAHLQHWGSRADPAQDSRCYLRTMA